MGGQCFVSARAYQARFPPSLWFAAMADTPRRQAGGSPDRPTRRRSVSRRRRSVGETRNCCCTCNCKVGPDMGSKEKLTDAASESDVSDGDSDHELQHVLKTLGVMRVGGKWQRQIAPAHQKKVGERMGTSMSRWTLCVLHSKRHIRHAAAAAPAQRRNSCFCHEHIEIHMFCLQPSSYSKFKLRCLVSGKCYGKKTS